MSKSKNITMNPPLIKYIDDIIPNYSRRIEKIGNKKRNSGYYLGLVSHN